MCHNDKCDRHKSVMEMFTKMYYSCRQNFEISQVAFSALSTPFQHPQIILEAFNVLTLTPSCTQFVSCAVHVSQQVFNTVITETAKEILLGLTHGSTTSEKYMHCFIGQMHYQSKCLISSSSHVRTQNNQPWKMLIRRTGKSVRMSVQQKLFLARLGFQECKSYIRLEFVNYMYTYKSSAKHHHVALCV